VIVINLFLLYFVSVIYLMCVMVLSGLTLLCTILVLCVRHSNPNERAPVWQRQLALQYVSRLLLMTDSGNKKVRKPRNVFLAASFSSSASENVKSGPEVRRCTTPQLQNLPSTGTTPIHFTTRCPSRESVPQPTVVIGSPPVPEIKCSMSEPPTFIDRTPASSPRGMSELNVAGLAPSPCATGSCDPEGSNSSSILRSALQNALRCGGGSGVNNGSEIEPGIYGISPAVQLNRRLPIEHQRIVDHQDIRADVSVFQMHLGNKNYEEENELRRRREFHTADSEWQEDDLQLPSDDDYAAEWYSIARVLDRLFFVVFFTANALVSIALLVVYPMYAPTTIEPFPVS
jgi:Neurotransmitter-gated ion-channel transmembrane region